MTHNKRNTCSCNVYCRKLTTKCKIEENFCLLFAILILYLCLLVESGGENVKIIK